MKLNTFWPSELRCHFQCDEVFINYKAMAQHFYEKHISEAPGCMDHYLITEQMLKQYLAQLGHNTPLSFVEVNEL